MPGRPMTMRWRIASAYLALLAATLGLLALISLQLLRATYLDTLQAGVAGQARLLAILVAREQQPLASGGSLRTLVEDAGARLDARVTIVTADGVALADSLGLGVGSSVLDRPEVRDALQRGEGASERVSAATGDDRLYFAVPIGSLATPQGVVRIGVPLPTIAQAQAQLAAAIASAALAAGGVTVLLALVIARQVTQPLLDLRAMASRLAAGDLEVQVPIPPDAEVAALAQDFNQMASRLRQLLHELRRAERSRRHLMSNIAHDLRTPLASLRAIVETLQDGALDDADAAPDFLRRMADEVDGLTRLVNEVLELSRLESGDLTLALAPAELTAIARGAAARMAEQAARAHLRISLDLPQDTPPLLLDAPRVEQALLNLLQNAITHTPPGGAVTVGATESADSVALWVRDTGAGIAPDDLPHIFERLYKGDPARSGGGAGLGLAIVKHLAERHHGSVRAESQRGAGTTITMVFPRPPERG